MVEITMINLMTLDVTLAKTGKKVSVFLSSLGAKKVVEQFPQGNIGEKRCDAWKVPKSRGVSLINLNRPKKMITLHTEITHVK